MPEKVALSHCIESVQPDSLQLKALEKLQSDCAVWLRDYDQSLITDAFKLCLYLNQDDSGDLAANDFRHILHISQVAVREPVTDDETLAATILYSAGAWSRFSTDEIKSVFGGTIAGLLSESVDVISTVSGNKESQKEVGQSDKFSTLLISMASNLRVIAIFLLDRLNLTQSMQKESRELQLAVANENLDHYIPLADRMGWYRIKSELEDVSFGIVDASAYETTAKKRDAYDDREGMSVGEFLDKLENLLARSGYKFIIKERPDYVYTIFRKMTKDNKSVEEIFSEFVVPVILSDSHSAEDCQKAASLLAENFSSNPEKFHDYVNLPKSDGYRAVHISLNTPAGQRADIRIQTEAMHRTVTENSEAERMEDFKDYVKDVLSNPNPDLMDD